MSANRKARHEAARLQRARVHRPASAKPAQPADKMSRRDYYLLPFYLAIPFVAAYIAMQLGWIEGTWREFLVDFPKRFFGGRLYFLLILVLLLLPLAGICWLFARRRAPTDKT
ncbi:MAG: hypothetical protein FJ304_00145 [Planctomycetes bacterium]|nr:hypothetical protein [Planctomycetota bacterium]